MNKQAISNEDFLRAYGFAKSNNPLPLTLPLSGVILSGDGYAKNYVDLVLPREGKTRMYVVPAFFKQLAKMLKINFSMAQKMDEETFGTILNMLKTLQSSHKSVKEVTVVFDPIQKKLTHISESEYSRISNGQLFSFAQALVESNPNLKIIEVLGAQDMVDCEIRILSSQNVALVGVESNDPEDFQFGLTLANRGVSTIIGDFAYRLVCENGMMGIRSDDRFKLGGTDTDNMFQLFQHFDKVAKQGFIPEDFNENVSTASRIPASLSELMAVYQHITQRLLPDFPEQRGMIEEAIKTRFFPELTDIEHKLARKNIDINDLTKKQMQMVRSDKTMWELINIVTDLGSNHSVYPISDTAYLQKLGGRLLTKPFDLKDIDLLIL